MRGVFYGKHGWNGYRNKSQHRKSTLEKKILPCRDSNPQPFNHMSSALTMHWAIPVPRYLLKVFKYEFVLIGSKGLVTKKSNACMSKQLFSIWLTAQHASSSKLLNLPTSLLYFTISTGYQSAAGFNTKYLSSASTLSLVQLLHTSLNCFISTLLLAFFAQPRILGSSMFLGWAEGPWGRDSFSALDLWSGTSFLSLSGIHLHSSFKSKLKTHLFSSAYWAVIFFSFYQPIPSNL